MCSQRTQLILASLLWQLQRCQTTQHHWNTVASIKVTISFQPLRDIYGLKHSQNFSLNSWMLGIRSWDKVAFSKWLPQRIPWNQKCFKFTSKMKSFTKESLMSLRKFWLNMESVIFPQRWYTHGVQSEREPLKVSLINQDSISWNSKITLSWIALCMIPSINQKKKKLNWLPSSSMDTGVKLSQTPFMKTKSTKRQSIESMSRSSKKRFLSTASQILITMLKNTAALVILCKNLDMIKQLENYP